MDGLEVHSTVHTYYGAKHLPGTYCVLCRRVASPGCIWGWWRGRRGLPLDGCTVLCKSSCRGTDKKHMCTRQDLTIRVRFPRQEARLLPMHAPKPCCLRVRRHGRSNAIYEMLLGQSSKTDLQRTHRRAAVPSVWSAPATPCHACETLPHWLVPFVSSPHCPWLACDPGAREVHAWRVNQPGPGGRSQRKLMSAALSLSF